MKVLLIQSYLGRKEDFPIYPLGLACIATAIHEKGHQVKVFDPNVVDQPYEQIKKCILSFSPDIIGISLRNIDNQLRINPFYYYKHFQQMLITIKDVNNDVKIIVGGTGFSMFAEKIMKRNHHIDFGIYLEGEDSFPELLDNLSSPESLKGIYFRRKEDVIFTGCRPLPDFKNMPIPRRDIADITPYLSHQDSIGIQTRRGCPLKCTYCNYPFLNGNNLRFREIKDICDEIEYLINNFGIKGFYFADAVFNMPEKFATEICDEIIRRNLKIVWSAYMDVKNLSKDFLLHCMEAGCRNIVFSPDGVSQNALDALQKGIKEKDIKDSIDLFTKNKELEDLNVVYSVFLNSHGETITGLIKTLIFYITGKLYLYKRGNVFLNWIRLEPDTKAFQAAFENKTITENLDLLPEDEKGLKKVFYSNPGLRFFDPFLMMMLKSLPALKKLLIKLRLR